MKKNTKNAFTLVEMILVTVIIGIVAGIVINVINIPRVQARSRDSKRIGDLKMIQTALELYFADKRMYPDNASDWMLLDSASKIDEFSNYIGNVPLDPRQGVSSGATCFNSIPNNYGYYYRSQTNGTYVLGGIMEIMDTSLEKRSCNQVDTSNCAPAAGYGCATANKRCYCVQNPM